MFVDKIEENQICIYATKKKDVLQLMNNGFRAVINEPFHFHKSYRIPQQKFDDLELLSHMEIPFLNNTEKVNPKKVMLQYQKEELVHCDFKSIKNKRTTSHKK